MGRPSRDAQRAGPQETVAASRSQCVEIVDPRDVTQPFPHPLAIAGAKRNRRAFNGRIKLAPNPAQATAFDAPNAGFNVGSHLGVAGPRQLTLEPRQAPRIDRDAFGAQAVASAPGGELERDPSTAQAGRTSNGVASLLRKTSHESRAPAVEMIAVARREMLAEVSAQIGHLQGET